MSFHEFSWVFNLDFSRINVIQSSLNLAVASTFWFRWKFTKYIHLVPKSHIPLPSLYLSRFLNKLCYYTSWHCWSQVVSSFFLPVCDENVVRMTCKYLIPVDTRWRTGYTPIWLAQFSDRISFSAVGSGYSESIRGPRAIICHIIDVDRWYMWEIYKVINRSRKKLKKCAL